MTAQTRLTETIKTDGLETKVIKVFDDPGRTGRQPRHPVETG